MTNHSCVANGSQLLRSKSSHFRCSESTGSQNCWNSCGKLRYSQQIESRDVWDYLLSQQMPSWHPGWGTHLHPRLCILSVGAIIPYKSFCYDSTKLSTLLSWWRGVNLEENGKFAGWYPDAASPSRLCWKAGLSSWKGYRGHVHICQQSGEEAWTIGRNASPSDLLLGGIEMLTQSQPKEGVEKVSGFKAAYCWKMHLGFWSKNIWTPSAVDV